jgi:hypothetical protein
MKATVKQIQEYIEEELQHMLDYPSMYGSLEQVELQFLQTIMLWGYIQDPSKGKRYVHQLFIEYLVIHFNRRPFQIAVQVDNDEDKFLWHMKTFKGYVEDHYYPPQEGEANDRKEHH